MNNFYDTSAMLRIENFDSTVKHCIVPTVLYELEDLKYKESDSLKSFQVRRAIRNIEEGAVSVVLPNEKKVQKFINKHGLPNNNDSKIVVGSLLVDKNSMFITYDAAESLIAKLYFKDRVSFLREDDEIKIRFDDSEYCGWIEVEATDEQLNILYQTPETNVFNLKTNEYCKILQNGELCDIIKWNGEKNTNLNYKDINSRFMGKIGPLDSEQKMAFDMLQNKDIKVQLITGSFGSGKSYVALCHAIDFVQRGLYDGIVFVRNNFQLKDTKDLGALPGTELEKIYPFLMPIADHVGGVDGLNMLIEDHVIEPVHLGFLRGRDIQRKIILCDECENMTRQQMQLLIGRVSKASQLWLIGDRRQTDSAIFERNNGITALIEKLSGDPLFGMVKLKESHRSAAASLADKLD